MHDKSFSEVPSEMVAPEGNRLSSESFDLTKTTLEQFKTIMRSPQGLDGSALLPNLDLSEPEATLALADNGNRVKEISRPDGSYYGSPSKEIRYDNGTVRWEFDDGSAVEIRKNGLAVGEDPNHEVTVKLPDGTWIHRAPGEPDAEVKEVVVEDDGTVWYHYKDGSMESIAPDNTRTFTYEYGNVITYPDGTQRFENNDGTWSWHDPSTGEWRGGDKDGTVRWEIDKDGRRKDYDENGRPIRKHR